MNISLPHKDFDKWNEYARERGTTFSGLVRAAIKEYIKKHPSSGSPVQSGRDLTAMISEVEQRLGERFTKMEEVLKEIKVEKPENGEEHGKIIKFVFNNIKSRDGVTTGTLVENLPYDRTTIVQFCNELRADGKITKGKDNKWRVTA